MKKIKLGIIGLSEGNGHPYSWSAIFNGYNPEVMKNCPFSVIPEYLSKQKFPEDLIQGGSVTHIWTQDSAISRDIAESCNIEHIVDSYADLIGKVDAVLLARDDVKMHYEMSAPFLKAGMPIYIDKPIAANMKMLKKIFSLQQYEGQIFTCSALRYAKEFVLTDEERESVGGFQYIDACIENDWIKYGVHIIEPVMKLIGFQGQITNIRKVVTGRKRLVIVDWQSGLQTAFSSLGDVSSPTVIRIFGNRGFKEMILNDTFFAFKNALQSFIDSINKGQEHDSREYISNIVKIIEGGNDYA